MSQPTLLPTVTLVDGTPRVSSLHIAEHFGKRHANALRLIKTIMADLPEDFTRLNFELSEYTDETGRKLPCYSLTRDAFVLVVMGFTGKAALAWKVRYIEAFNQMEKALTGQAALPQKEEPVTSASPVFIYPFTRRPATTSLAIGQELGLTPGTIERDIILLWDIMPEEFRANNFIEDYYIDKEGKKQLIYFVHREGFMLLAMGYTDKKVIHPKIAYIEAFNKMEARLAERKALPQPALPVFSPKSTSRTTHAQRKELRDAINLWADTADTSRDVVAHQVRLRFGVTRTDRIPAEKLPEAVNWIRNAIFECTADNTPELMKWVRTQTDTATKDLPDTARLFDDIRKAEKALQPVEHWTHLKVRWELRRKANPQAVDAVNMHVNAAWYALGLARSSLLAAIAVGRIA